MRHRWTRLAAAVVSAALGPAAAIAAIAVTATGAATGSTAAGASYRHATRATGSTVGLANPATNVAPSPDYWPTCATSGTSSQPCYDAVLAAVNHARSLEGVPPMVLPAGFAAMSTAEQTFVVSNLERVDRGLAPVAGMVDSLDTIAATAAADDADPIPTSLHIDAFTGDGWGSIWAGDLNALAADYDWMYNDGWSASGSVNLDCAVQTATGCWGHRDNILMPDNGEILVTGVGSVVQPNWTSIAQLLVRGTGGYPAFATSWADVTGVPAPAPPAPSTTPTPSPTPTPVVPDPTRVTVSVPSTVVAGHAARVLARVTDAVTGHAIAATAVSLCRRAATATTTICSHPTTDATGAVALSTAPTVATSYWLVFAGTATAAPVTSGKATVHVRPAVAARSAHLSTGWRVSATMTPARGQAVRLQRHTASGWVTVRRTTAHSSMAFTRLHSGSYRVVVSAVTGSLSAVAGVRAA